MTTETVIEKVRTQLGPLSAQAEQAVLATFKLMQNAGRFDMPIHVHEAKFVGENITLEEYVALPREERRRYLDDAEPPNQAWIENQLARLQARWIMVVDGQVVLHGASMQSYPEDEEFLKLCQGTGKYPFVFFHPLVHAIEENFAAWHKTIEPGDAYPAVALALANGSNHLALAADVDTGAVHSFCDLDLLKTSGVIEIVPYQSERYAQHLSRPYIYFTKRVTLELADENGKKQHTRVTISCVQDWQSSPFVTVNPARKFLLGRQVLFELRPRLTLDFAARCTEVQFSETTN
ncbi:MAG: hypothetical protein AAB354_06905 [candidate division KSB1 bacterium]